MCARHRTTLSADGTLPPLNPVPEPRVTIGSACARGQRHARRDVLGRSREARPPPAAAAARRCRRSRSGRTSSGFVRTDAGPTMAARLSVMDWDKGHVYRNVRSWLLVLGSRCSFSVRSRSRVVLVKRPEAQTGAIVSRTRNGERRTKNDETTKNQEPRTKNGQISIQSLSVSAPRVPRRRAASRCPARRYTGGFLPCPTPGGVPVVMTSPGCRLMKRLR